jgi:hypothetical protein
MAKESLYGVPKAPIFRETFNSEQNTRLLNGIPSNVVFDKGVGIFNGSASLRYAKNFNGVYSIRIQFSSIAYQVNKYLFDFRNVSGVGSGYCYFSAGILGISSGNCYINSVNTSTLTTTKSEVTITGITLNSSSFSFMYNYLNAFNAVGDVELIEIYDYTLTANEVKNLYNNKRNRDLQLVGIPFGQQYAITSGVSNSLIESSSKTWTTASGGTFIVKFTQNVVATGSMFFMDSASPRIWGVQYVGTTRVFNFFFGTAFARTVTSNASVPIAFNGFVKVWARTSGSDMLIDFYSSLDGITYTQLGTTITNAGGANSFSLGASTLQIGANGTAPGANWFNGNVYGAWAYDANGVLFSSFDPTLYRGGDSWVAETGETWTVKSAQIYQGTKEIFNASFLNGNFSNKYDSTLTTNNSPNIVRDGSILCANYEQGITRYSRYLSSGLTGDKTLILWFKPSCSMTGACNIFTNGQFCLQADWGGGQTYYFSRTNFVGTYRFGGAIERGKWQMLVVTTTASGSNVIIYKNSIVVASGNIQTPSGTVGAINIGNSSPTSGGRVSTVRVIEGILTAEEVSQLWSNERKNYLV